MDLDRDPDANSISQCALCKLKEQHWRLGLLSNTDPVQCLMVQGPQVSDPAHLDLKVYPHGALIWGQARSTGKQMEEDGWEIGQA